MQTLPVELDRGKARELYREYKKHLHWSVERAALSTRVR
jgi:hypothetical protein